MALPDTSIRKAKPTDKPQRLFDGGGLYLELSPAGGKWWRLKYRLGARRSACPLASTRIGSHPIAAIDAPELLKLLCRIEGRGAHETAHRTKQRCGQVFRYAISTGRAKHDADLRGALAPVVSTSRAAITDPAKVGETSRARSSSDRHGSLSDAIPSSARETTIHCDGHARVVSSERQPAPLRRQEPPAS